MNNEKDLVRAGSTRTWGMLSALALLSVGCAASTTSSPAEGPPASSGEATAPGDEGAVAKKEAVKKEAEKEKGPKLVHTLKEVGLERPEAIIYDDAADVYLVSNINGDALAEDGNGFISRVGPDGKIVELKWIDGQKAGVTLNAPKGMAVSEGFLYVSDITWIRIFDRKTGEPKGKIFAKGATFLNDVTTNGKGEVVFSDTGWKSGKEGYAATGSDAVFHVDPKTVAAKELIRGKELGNPNGLAATKEGIWAVNDQGELFLVGKDGKKEKTTKLAKGGLDGVVALEDGSFLVSSHKGNAIYHGKPGEEFQVLVGDLKSPASIGYDSKRGRVLVPDMMENQALIYDLSGKAVAEPSDKKADSKSEKKTASAEAPPAKAEKDDSNKPAGSNAKPANPPEKGSEKPSEGKADAPPPAESVKKSESQPPKATAASSAKKEEPAAKSAAKPTEPAKETEPSKGPEPSKAAAQPAKK